MNETKFTRPKAQQKEGKIMWMKDITRRSRS